MTGSALQRMLARMEKYTTFGCEIHTDNVNYGKVTSTLPNPEVIYSEKVCPTVPASKQFQKPCCIIGYKKLENFSFYYLQKRGQRNFADPRARTFTSAKFLILHLYGTHEVIYVLLLSWLNIATFLVNGAISGGN